MGVPTWAGVAEAVVRRLEQFLRHPNVRLISVRDNESQYWLARNMKLNVPVRKFADMVCAMPLPAVARPAGKPIFTLISRKQMPGEIHWKNVAALCARAASLGYRVRCLVLGTGSTRTDDLSTLESEKPPIDWEIEQSENLDRLTRLIGESTFVASMKFHGCVVATMYGVPAVILSTTDKFESFLRMIDRPDLHAHHTFEDLPDRLPRFVAPIPRHTINHLRNDARKGLESLRESLQEDLGAP